MTQKMKEMDDVIRRVHAASLQDNLERTLLVCDSFFFSTSSLLSLVTYMYVTKKIVPAYTGDYIENTCVCSMLDKVYLFV